MTSSPRLPAAMAIVIMGVSGSGKSRIGELLAKELNSSYIDADDFHPTENKDKMRKGIPLTDSDRIPWLETLRDILRDAIREGKGVVLACSALQPLYRRILRTADNGRIQEKENNDVEVERSEMNEHERIGCIGQDMKFFLLNGPIGLFASRLEERHKQGKHFMPPCLLQSQMDALSLSEDEGIIFLDASKSPGALVNEIKGML